MAPTRLRLQCVLATLTLLSSVACASSAGASRDPGVAAAAPATRLIRSSPDVDVLLLPRRGALGRVDSVRESFRPFGLSSHVLESTRDQKLLDNAAADASAAEDTEDALLAAPADRAERSRVLEARVRDCAASRARLIPDADFAPDFELGPRFQWPQDQPGMQERDVLSVNRFTFDTGFGSTTFATMFRLNRPPRGHFAVFPPLGGCARDSGVAGLSRPSANARANGCIAATNGGFFEPDRNSPVYGACLGTLISNGTIVQQDYRKNAAFAVTRSGRVLVGYLTPSVVLSARDPVVDMVAGVTWLVRNGDSHVERSWGQDEDRCTQTTGSRFDSVISARTGLGVDAHGRVVLVTVDGKTDRRGASLYDLADAMRSVGVVQAINLDGGGSVSASLRGTVLNVPSDVCQVQEPGSAMLERLCERQVASVVCLR